MDAEDRSCYNLHLAVPPRHFSPFLNTYSLKSVHIYAVMVFPEWQNICIEIVKQAYCTDEGKVDDVKVKDLLVVFTGSPEIMLYA